MFQFRRFPLHTYVFSMQSPCFTWWGFPIRIPADRSLFAAPRSLSQLVTSFVGSWCQGIHLMLFFAWTSFVLFILLEFAYNLFYNEKAFSHFLFLGFAYLSICGQIVVFHDFRKDLDFWSQFLLLNPVKLSVRFSYLVFNEHSFYSVCKIHFDFSL